MSEANPAPAETSNKLAKNLSAFDLTVLGVAAIIGAGIFVLTGTAAATSAGPAVALSFVLGAIGSGIAALCFAELSTALPSAGATYSFVYSSMGRFAAWIVGAALVLEYTVSSITVSVGWSGYLVEVLKTFNITMPEALCRGYFDGGLINLPAMLQVTVVTVLLLVGVKESARAATILVLIKLVIIALFIAMGARHVEPANWKPFMPFGWSGVLTGAGVVYFSFIGFDAVATSAEEAKNPQRDLVIGILGSLFLCTVLYIAVAMVLTGMVPYVELDRAAPIAYAMEKFGMHSGHLLISIGSMVALSSVAIAMMMGQTRIFMAMSRDKLIPAWLAAVHPRFHTPHGSVWITGVAVMIGAALMPVGAAGETTSIGALTAFGSVCVAVVILRRTQPNLKRVFRVPLAPYLPILGAIICFVIMLSMTRGTWIRYGSWMVIALVMWFVYGRHHGVSDTHNKRGADTAL